MGVRFRLLPALIAVAAVMLTLKLGNIWRGVSSVQDGVDMRSALAAEDGARDGSASPAANAQAEAPAIAPADTASGQASITASPSAAQAGSAPVDPRQLSNSEIRLLQALAVRRDELDRRERSLNQREALLRAAEQKLVDRQTQLAQMRGEVREMLDALDEREKKRIGNLVKVYENMKPKDAAKIFNELELPVMMSVVERMKVRKLAPIIAAMTPDKARKVTRALAKRQKKPADGAPAPPQTN